MKSFLILLALGLAASEKLDRTYLPPPGAKFSGGSPGAILTPLELPKQTYPNTGTLVSENGLPSPGDSRSELGISRGQPEFGQVTTKAPFTYYTENLPTTTTSYAFTQTTTLPPLEAYGTTVGPINPVTGLPVQYASQNLGNLGFSTNPENNLNIQGQRPNTPSFVINGQLGTEGQTNYGQPSYNQDNQLLGQYQDQYPITVIPGRDIQTGLVSQLPNQQGFQYPDGQNVVQVIPSTPAPQFSSSNAQSSANFQPESNSSSYGSNASPILPTNSQSAYPTQQNQGQNLRSGFNQPSNGQNQSDQGIPSQYSENQKQPVSGLSENYQPGSSSSPEYINQPGYSSTTPQPSISSTVAPTFGSYVRPERPQAEADRNAVILSFENVRTPNGYSYSYDTSNGIHADESGYVDNGTKAKGSYSYIGDDGKFYSVTYTADENGFQPRGDHLPTPPPIPEAIQKVIEQATREKEAGISDDGSYNEEKYGDNKYQGKLNKYTSPNQGSNQFDNSQYVDRQQNNRGKPIAISGDVVSNDRNENVRPDQFRNDNNINKELVKIPSRGSTKFGNDINQPDIPVSGTDGTKPSFGYGSNIQGAPILRSGQKGTELEYPESQATYVEPGKYSESDINNTPELIGSNLQNVNDDGSILPNRPGADTSAGISNVFGNPQTFIGDKERVYTPQRPGPSNIRYTEEQGFEPEKAFVQKEAYNVFGNRRPGSKTDLNIEQADSIKPTYNQRTSVIKDRNYVNDNGYTYNRPQTKFEQNNFPTRFRGQESSMEPEEYSTTQGTTLKPFMTPNVYNKKDGAQSSLKRKPFEVILPTTESYEDYSDNNEYPEKDQGMNAERFGPNKVTVDKTGTTIQPYQVKQSTRPYQYTPSNQGTSITQRVTPGSMTAYSIASTTPMPSQNSRFGTPTQKPVTQYQPRPTTTVVPGFIRNRPNSEVPSRSGFVSQSNEPAVRYTTTKAPGSSSASDTFGSRLPSANRFTPQSYSTTYRPVDYSATTVKPGFDLSSAPVSSAAYPTGYQYGNSGPKLSYGSSLATSRPVPIPSGPGMYSQVAPGSTYQYGLVDYSQSTTGPVTGRPGSNFQTGNSQVSPTGTYQSGYQYGPGLPTASGIIQPGTSTSESVTTPQSYPSSTYRPGVTQGYTQRPITVDTFGRPISEGVYYPGYLVSEKGIPSYSQGNRGQIPISNQQSVGSVDSTGSTYPGYGTTEKVIGEDFSGPKQPQRFDSKTGYHY